MPNWCYNTITILDKPEGFIPSSKLTEKDGNMIESLPASKRTDKVVRPFLDDKGNFDFEKFIPMPEDIRNTESGSKSDDAIVIYMNAVYPTDNSLNWRKPYTQEKFDKLLNAIKRENRFGCRFRRIPAEELKRDNLEEILKLGEKLCHNLETYGYSTWYEWSYANWDTKWPAADTSYDGVSELHFDTAYNPPVNVLACWSMLFPDVIIMDEWWEEGGGASNLIFINGTCYERLLTGEETIERFGYDNEDEADREEKIDDIDASREDEDPPVYKVSAVYKPSVNANEDK